MRNGHLSRSLQGCATVAVGPFGVDPRSPHNLFQFTLEGSAERHVARSRRSTDRRFWLGWIH